MSNVIKHANIVYVRNINPIGGVETYAYELIKEYKDLDIAVVCKTIAPEQLKRIKKYCKVYIHKDELIDCKVAIINWDTSIIDYITPNIWKENAKEDEGIYQGIHADYTHPSQGKIPQDPRIKKYLAITEDILNNFNKLTKQDNVILCRNPLQVELEEKPLVLVSPTRLTEEKGGDMMYSLANALDSLNIKYIWIIPTIAEYKNNIVFDNPNVIWVKNSLDVAKFINIASWVVLPSKTEGDSYSFKEALYRGVPIVVRYLKYFDEIGIKDGINALFINENNIMDVARKMKHPLVFNFKPIQDGYSNLLYKSKSHYKEEKDMRYLVEALPIYEETATVDSELKRVPKAGEQWEVDSERLDVLLGGNDSHVVFVKMIKPLTEKVEKSIVSKSSERATKKRK